MYAVLRGVFHSSRYVVAVVIVVRLVPHRAVVRHRHYRSGGGVFTCKLMWGGSSVGRASDQHAADTGSIPRCGKGFLCQIQFSVQTLTVFVHLLVQLHVFTSVRTLKIP